MQNRSLNSTIGCPTSGGALQIVLTEGEMDDIAMVVDQARVGNQTTEAEAVATDSLLTLIELLGNWLLGNCFWREGFEAAFGPDRMGEKGG